MTASARQVDSRNRNGQASDPYRVLIEDRLAFVAEHDTLDLVLADLGARLSEITELTRDADLAIWRSDRLEAVVLCRPGRAFDVARLKSLPTQPQARRRPRITIGALMLVVFGCGLILAALRTGEGVEWLKSVVMLGLLMAVAASSVVTIYYTVAFFRDEPRR